MTISLEGPKPSSMSMVKGAEIQTAFQSKGKRALIVNISNWIDLKVPGNSWQIPFGLQSEDEHKIKKKSVELGKSDHMKSQA